MRHGKKFNHLGRTASHRKAMLSNMATSLIVHKRINTTIAKAKELRKYVEPLLTRAKEDTTHSRRIVFSYLQNKDTLKTLFGEVAEKISNRPGGYTRILKTGHRLGDNADMCIIELVDYNELLLKDTTTGKAKTRRSRRGGGKSKAANQPEGKAADKSVKDDAKVEATAKADSKDEEISKVDAKAEETEKEKPKNQTETDSTDEKKDQ
ncbi:MAG: 50S ribosomal protein L17 [Bacteroidota bacterium]|nr:50S ribosomal protein L17 [Bacteroidota bacterium]